MRVRTGRFGAGPHAWGLRVEGADLSPGMIELARARRNILRMSRPPVRFADSGLMKS